MADTTIELPQLKFMPPPDPSRKVLLAIDPGTTESAYVVYCGTLWQFGLLPNEKLLEEIKVSTCTHLCIEEMRSYGQTVGIEVFQTIFWAGRFAQAFNGGPFCLLTRGDVKLHLCQDARAKDKDVREALIYRFGGPEQTKKGGVLHKVAGDMWAALGVAVTWWDNGEKA